MNRQKISLFDLAALLLSIFSLFVTFWVTETTFEAVPHIEDEMAYVWQGRLYADGQTTIVSPPCNKNFMIPFVIDYQGLRFSKYPPGWPALLSLGIRLGIRSWVNPILAALSVWFIYRLVKKILDEKTALLAAGLTLSSPFFLMNSGSLLSHNWSLFLCTVFCLAWIDTFDSKCTVPKGLTVAVAGLTLGLVALTRPLTAVGFVIPFAVHGIIIMIKGDASRRRKLFLIVALAAALAVFYVVWNYDLTGTPLINPYTLYWPYDTVGFGPGHGIQTNGYALRHAWINAKFSLSVGNHDVFGWPYLGWIFLPFGLMAIRKNSKGWLVSSIALSLVLIYCLYWIGSWLFGPRYYYEGIPSIVLLTAAGIRWLAGKADLVLKTRFKMGFPTIRFTVITFIVVSLVTANIMFYIPQRLRMMVGLYGINRSQQEPFFTQDAKDLAPALIIVHPDIRWHQYGSLVDLTDPYMDTPLLFAYSRKNPSEEQCLRDAFPDRTVWHYTPRTPYTFYKTWDY